MVHLPPLPPKPVKTLVGSPVASSQPVSDENEATSRVEGVRPSEGRLPARSGRRVVLPPVKPQYVSQTVYVKPEPTREGSTTKIGAYKTRVTKNPYTAPTVGKRNYTRFFVLTGFGIIVSGALVFLFLGAFNVGENQPTPQPSPTNVIVDGNGNKIG